MLYEAALQRKLEVSIVGVPKSIDNDVLFIDRTFGFNTAVAVRVPFLRSSRRRSWRAALVASAVVAAAQCCACVTHEPPCCPPRRQTLEERRLPAPPDRTC